MKLSKKKESELWKVINDCVVDVRIKLAKMQSNSDLVKVDQMLFGLGIDCPEKAIQLFKPKPIKKNKV